MKHRKTEHGKVFLLNFSTKQARFDLPSNTQYRKCFLSQCDSSCSNVIALGSKIKTSCKKSRKYAFVIKLNLFSKNAIERS